MALHFLKIDRAAARARCGQREQSTRHSKRAYFYQINYAIAANKGLPNKLRGHWPMPQVPVG